MGKINNYLGICKKANYLIIGSDNLKNYTKKLYLLVVCGEITNTIKKTVNDLLEGYADLKCIILNEEFGNAIGIEHCKIVGVKNKGLCEEILKNDSEFKFWN